MQRILLDSWHVLFEHCITQTKSTPLILARNNSRSFKYSILLSVQDQTRIFPPSYTTSYTHLLQHQSRVWTEISGRVLLSAGWLYLHSALMADSERQRTILPFSLNGHTTFAASILLKLQERLIIFRALSSSKDIIFLVIHHLI